MSHFLSERCVVTPEARATAGALYKAYQGWCEASGELPLSQKRFGGRLKDSGYRDGKENKGNRAWFGVGLLVPSS